MTIESEQDRPMSIHIHSKHTPLYLNAEDTSEEEDIMKDYQLRNCPTLTARVSHVWPL